MPGVELIGEYEHSGYKEPPSIVRRPDGQVIQLPPLLYLLVELADGKRNYDELAKALSTGIARSVTAEDVVFLVDEKLAPMGLVSASDGVMAEGAKADPFLALKFRMGVIPERVTATLARIFKPLFLPPVVFGCLAAWVAVDVWLFGFHGVAQAVRQALFQPGVIVVLLAMVVASAAFHESGHAAACGYGGAVPGRMGSGLYLAWPAFYTDVTDSYRLGRRGRLRTDLGGVYFNVIFILMVAAIYLLTGFQPLLLAIVIVHFEIAHQLLPVIRLDGYYVVSDLTGVPDLFNRIGPILRSAIPGKPADERVLVLKRWVRAAVTLWVVVIVPVLLAELTLVLINLPRILGTAWSSAVRLYGQAANGYSSGAPLSVVVAVLQLLVLAIPVVGIALMLYRSGQGISRGVWRATESHPSLRLVAGAGGAAAVALLALAWLPAHNYRPIRPGERGTVQASAGSFVHLVSHDSIAPSPANSVSKPDSPNRAGHKANSYPVRHPARPTSTTSAPASTTTSLARATTTTSVPASTTTSLTSATTTTSLASATTTSLASATTTTSASAPG